MTKAELQKQINALQAQLDSMKETKTVWNLKEGDAYWHTTTHGTVEFDGYAGGFTDSNRRNQGNVFLTEQEAKDEARRREIQTQLKRLAGGYEFLIQGYNYSIRWNLFERELMYCCASYIIQQGTIYFPTEEAAEAAVAEIGEDNIKFLLGVK